jgi:hypothetical protein
LQRTIVLTLTDEQVRDLDRMMPWGVGGRLWSAIVDDLLLLFKEHGPDVIIGLIINNRLKVREVLPVIGAAEIQANRLKETEK